MHRVKLRIILPVVFLVLLVAAAGYVYRAVRQAQPVYSGSVALPGLSAPVTVRYGPHGVPSVKAASREDLFYAQGYVLARERMWQMDLIRRVALGRLSELFGDKTLAVDRLFRTLGLGRSAEADLRRVPAQLLGYLRAYAAGVNAYIQEKADALPLEYRLTRTTPQPWRPLDSLAVGAYMSFLVSYNLREELVYLRLARRLDRDRLLELFPTDAGIPAPDYGHLLPDYAADGPWSPDHLFGPYQDLAEALDLPMPGPASNAWAVSGAHTADGAALLANDPHLAATQPAGWYELELDAPGYHVAGFALPGLPFVVFGHNRDLAWGITAALADTQDLYMERPGPDGRSVERPGGRFEPIREWQEEIVVRGRDRPEHLTLRSTSHGVVLNHLLREQRGIPLDFVELDSRLLVTLKWTLDLPGHDLEGIYRLNTATTIEGARGAVRMLVHAANNFLIAHRDGGIGWQMSGALPVRAKGSGTFPAPGWTDEYDWQGMVPAERNPGGSHPSSGILVQANNRGVAGDSRLELGRSWMPDYRARRIRALLDASKTHTPATFARIQMDRASTEARHYQAALSKLETQLRRIDPTAWAIARDRLLPWDARMEPDSAPAALYSLLRHALFDALYGDELGLDLDALESIYLVSYNALQEVVRSGRSAFWDDVRTPAVIETPAQIWARALHRADEELDRRLGSGSKARLDRLQRLVFPHAFHRIPGLGDWFDVGPIGVGGGDYTVNVMKTQPSAPQRPLFVPVLRAVYPTGDWKHSRATLPTGQSGHLYSPYRSDQLDDWLRGGSHPLPWNGPTGGTGAGTLLLLPVGEGRVQSGNP